MPQLRTSSHQQVDAAIEELEALTSSGRGMSAVRAGPEKVRITVGRQSWPATVIARDAVSLRDARLLVEAEPVRSTVIVANQLSADAKDFLAERNEGPGRQGWSWLDRRGELQLNHPRASGVVHFGDPPVKRRAALPGGWRLAAPRSDGPIRGRAGISYAAALLLHPAEPPSIRAIAKRARMSHGAIGAAAKLLRTAGLVMPSGAPQIPDLFWALAAVWSPTRISPVANRPTADSAAYLGANLDDLDGSGWCLGGDEAAASWRAPVVSAATRPWIWVPGEGDARRAERALVPATWDNYAAVVAVPPTALVTGTRLPAPTSTQLPFLPTTHPLFLALELAQDPARGREILDQWQPESEGFPRVW